MHSHNVPALRLEGFDGEWAIEAIGEFSRLLPHNSLSRDQLTNLDTGVSNVHYGDILVKLPAITSPDDLPCVKEAGQFLKQIGHLLADGDVVFADAAEDLAVGKCTEVRGVGGKQVVAGLHTIPIRPLRSFGEAFLGYAFNADSFHNRLIPRVQGTKVSSISAGVLLETDLAIPPTLEEQQAIGAIFTNLDIAINQHAKKHQALQQAKTALMQRMFPQEGQTVPELRLEGFDGKWEDSSLNDHVEFFSGLTYSPGDVVKNGGTLVLRSSNVQDATLAFDDCVYVSSGAVNVQNVKPNDIIMVVRNGSRALIGKHALVRRELPPTVIGAFMTGIRSKQPHFMSALFDTELFESQVAKSMGATINQITGGMFAKMRFLFPPTFKEQQAIGAVFTRLDTLIATEAKYIESLKQAKLALLQRMFI